MRKMTKESLKAAFAGESQAHMKYTIYAEEAEKAGFKNIARLFRAIAYAEKVHATNHLKQLQMIKKTPDNLQVAIDGETFEVEEMYPAYKSVAELQKENGALRSFKWALEAEKIHAEMYKKAKDSAEQGKDIKIEKIYICPICGYTVENEPPERCPVCGYPGDKFVKF